MRRYRADLPHHDFCDDVRLQPRRFRNAGSRRRSPSLPRRRWLRGENHANRELFVETVPMFRWHRMQASADRRLQIFNPLAGKSSAQRRWPPYLDRHLLEPAAATAAALPPSSPAVAVIGLLPYACHPHQNQRGHAACRCSGSSPEKRRSPPQRIEIAAHSATCTEERSQQRSVPNSHPAKDLMKPVGEKRSFSRVGSRGSRIGIPRTAGCRPGWRWPGVGARTRPGGKKAGIVAGVHDFELVGSGIRRKISRSCSDCALHRPRRNAGG